MGRQQAGRSRACQGSGFSSALPTSGAGAAGLRLRPVSNVLNGVSAPFRFILEAGN